MIFAEVIKSYAHKRIGAGGYFLMTVTWPVMVFQIIRIAFKED